MADPFIGEIIIFGGSFNPRGWAFCNGQLLDIATNSALFAILGTTYGGDGRTTFALPDLRGRLPMHPGTGPGLTPRSLGQRGGTETVTLTASQIPAHNHPVSCNNATAGEDDPQGLYLGAGGGDIYATTSNNVQMNAGMIGSNSGGQAHSNVQPFLCLSFIIALVGIFPSRN